MMKKIIASSLLVGLMLNTACSSSPKMANGLPFQKDETLSTAGDKPAPDWVEQGELQPFVIKSGKVYSVGITTLRGDERPEAGVRIAENNARANFAKSIENRMEFLFQGAEENAGFDSTQAKWIGSEASSITSHSMVAEGRWWKRYSQMQENGDRRIFYKIYSLVTMSEPDLKQAVFKAANKGVANNQVSAEFQKQVSKQWDRFVEGSNEQQPEARNPASRNSN